MTSLTHYVANTRTANRQLIKKMRMYSFPFFKSRTNILKKTLNTAADTPTNIYVLFFNVPDTVFSLFRTAGFSAFFTHVFFPTVIP
jgi:hypothetical protein